MANCDLQFWDIFCMECVQTDCPMCILSHEAIDIYVYAYICETALLADFMPHYGKGSFAVITFLVFLWDCVA